MKNIVVTIARQYGSGGKTLGQMLAKQMGVHVYNREILKLASEDSGINEALFNQVDEKLRTRVLTGLMTRQYTGELFTPENVAFLSDNNLFNYQAKVIKHLAETESCVIIGRCADYVLRDHPNVINIFIKASNEERIRRIVNIYGIDPADAEESIRKADKQRASYYNYYATGTWGSVDNYHLCVDTGVMGINGAVELICKSIEIREKKIEEDKTEW